MLTKAHERLDERGETKLFGLLAAGDPRGEVRMTWHAKKSCGRSTTSPPEVAASSLTNSPLISKTTRAHPNSARSAAPSSDGATRSSPGTDAFVSNGPTEAVNNLIKRIKRVGFGFRKFVHYRIRVLLYAGKPNWDLLATVTPR